MKFPFFAQADSMDCGPACLRMIAQYYGRSYSLETLRKSCFISRDGVSLLGISETAENIGFKTFGGRFSFEKLLNEIPLPCIVHWRQEHFVVVYKTEKPSFFNKEAKIFVADPGHGLIIYTAEEYKSMWISTKDSGEDLGIALLLEPTENFYLNAGERKNTNSIKFLISYFLRYKRFFTQLLLGLLIGSILQLIFPFLTQSIVDIGIQNQNIGFISLVLLAQMVLFLSRTSIDFIRRWILLHISTRINVSLISDFFIKLMNLPMHFFDTKLMGDLLQRMEDHRRVQRFLTVQTLNIIFSIFSFIIFSIVLYIYSTKIILIFIAGSILYGLWVFLFLKRRRVLDYKYFEQQSINQSKTYQLINGMQEIKLQNCETRKRWEWEDVQADLFKVNVAALRLQQLQEAGNVFITETKNILITVIAATSVIHNELTLGMMLAIQYIIGQLNSPIEQAVQFIHDFQDTKISLERINEIHLKEDENSNRMDKLDICLPNKMISIKDLSFQYEGPYSPKALDRITITIPEGKVTAIVGSSGSGKTTLVKLLLQFYEPTNGDIRIGNLNLNTFNTKWWRKKCGAVMQDGFLFSESIAKNIALCDNSVDIDRLLYASKMANINEFIDGLPLKYNTIIGQEGQGISQGQRQRILIARVIYKNPDFVFLDEATNSLDANNEKVILDNLSEFYKGKTVVVVAHRLSTVKNADQIVVLDKGIIVESGNHKQLKTNKGPYYNLVKNQLELGN